MLKLAIGYSPNLFLPSQVLIGQNDHAIDHVIGFSSIKEGVLERPSPLKKKEEEEEEEEEDERRWKKKKNSFNKSRKIRNWIGFAMKPWMPMKECLWKNKKMMAFAMKPLTFLKICPRMSS